MKAGILPLVCFAIAGWAASPALAQKTVTVTRGSGSYLGIGVVEITPDRAKTLNLKEERGAEVAHVDEDGPAAKAGIKEGDVVLQYNGEAVEGVDQFVRMVRETPVGRQVKLVVWRNGSDQTLTATVGERKGGVMHLPFSDGASVNLPPLPPMPEVEIPRFQMSWQSPVLGIEGESLGQNSQLADFFGVKDGVLVKNVTKNSAAEKAGLKAGDVITKVDDTSVGSTREITSALRAGRNKPTSNVTLVRAKKETTVSVNLEDQRRSAFSPDRTRF